MLDFYMKVKVVGDIYKYIQANLVCQLSTCYAPIGQIVLLLNDISI